MVICGSIFFMSEKEKMLSGQMYNAADEELTKDRERCKCLCHRYNSLSPELVDERKNLMTQILGKTGENFLIEPNFWCDYGYNIEIGENFYVNHNCVMLDCAKITFGDNVFIAPNCGFYTAGHPLDFETRNSGLEFAKPIKVGNNVWIGGGVTVLPDVEIGDNVVIGAGSVVTKSIPANTVTVGNPCRVIKENK